MCDTKEAKEGFYDKLNVTMNSIPHYNKIVFLEASMLVLDQILKLGTVFLVFKALIKRILMALLSSLFVHFTVLQATFFFIPTRRNTRPRGCIHDSIIDT